MTGFRDGTPETHGVYEVETEYPERCFSFWDGKVWHHRVWAWDGNVDIAIQHADSGVTFCTRPDARLRFREVEK